MEPQRISSMSAGSVTEEHSRPEEADSDDLRHAKYNKLRAWLDHERDRQCENRAEMAIDGDYYDGLQWSEADAQEIEKRGQAPLVFNETKVSIDWIIGAEKRNRVDWRVLPREDDDEKGAEVRTKVLKYLSDVNRVPFTRSEAFAECVKSGLSWLEDGLSMDATEDILYSGNESWRNVLHDSYHKRLDGKDMRYLFRWRYLDLDIAQALWPKHKEALARTAMAADQLTADDDDELWYLGQNLRDPQTHRSSATRNLSMTGSSIGTDRQRVKVYEAWYRQPDQAEVMFGGPYHGEVVNPKLPAHQRAIQAGKCEAIAAIVLRMRVAFMTDAELLEDCETPFAHNQFPLTPLYCFRRGRDGMAYGHIRQMRDPQSDLNKRMSKSLFLLSVNQLIAEERTFSTEKEGYTIEDAIANVSNPQGVFILKDGTAKFEIRRDFAEIRGHTEILALDRMFLQSASGVNYEQLGRDTNVISGKGILAKQEQGAFTTAGVFDNYRLAILCSGQKSLSNVEKFYTMPKIVRLTASQVGEQQPKIEWVKINEPELQADGSVRFLNDITDSHADFVVDEQDYRASMRQAMFDQLLDMLKIIAPVAPAMAVGLLDIIVDANDFPGKEEFIGRIRQLLAEARGELKSEEQKAEEAAVKALELQGIAAKIAKDESAADKTDAEADTLRAALDAGMVAVDLERTPQGQVQPGTATQPAEGEQKPSMAPPPAARASGTPPAAGAPAAGAANEGQAETLEAVAAALEQGARLEQMMTHQAAMTAQQIDALRAENAQTLQQMMLAMREFAAVRSGAGPARSKTIRLTMPDGTPIVATVETTH